MKKQILDIVKAIGITCFCFLMVSPVTAQKVKRQPLITQDEINKINAIVKPLKDQFDKQLSQDKTYLTYLADVKKVTEAKSIQDKKILTAGIEKKYLSFFQNVWASAKIDEKAYQERIRGVFPSNIASLVHFDAFLCFSITLSYFATVPQEPPPPDICLDVCTIAAGQINADDWLISGGSGSYGNCYLKTNSWAAAVGTSASDGFLKNNITIPGTLPDDGHKLRITKSYELKQDACSFAVGGGVASAVLVTFIADEQLNVCAPVLWMAHSLRTKTLSEDYTLQKADVAKSKFEAFSEVGSILVSGSWSSCECTSIKWKICEVH